MYKFPVPIPLIATKSNLCFFLSYQASSTQTLPTIIFFIMLILIAGVTGNLGQHIARVALHKGHQVRGLGRSLGKLNTSVAGQLESFVVTSSYYDIPALDQAMIGVDAVVCAYSGRPELALDGNLLLLRAAERANIKV